MFQVFLGVYKRIQLTDEPKFETAAKRDCVITDKQLYNTSAFPVLSLFNILSMGNSNHLRKSCHV